MATPYHLPKKRGVIPQKSLFFESTPSFLRYLTSVAQSNASHEGPNTGKTESNLGRPIQDCQIFQKKNLLLRVT